MRTIQVSADDFGLCREIDEGILELCDRGVVTRTSVLANAERLESTAPELGRRGDLEIGVHLNLTDGHALRPASEIRSLVDSTGTFSGGRHYGLIARLSTGAIRAEEVRREWTAQIERALSLGLRISHLNAHGHLHLHPALHGVVLDLVEDLGIPALRLVVQGDGVRGAMLGLLSAQLLADARRRGLHIDHPDRVLGLRRPGRLTPSALARMLERAASGTTEIIVHPSRGANPFHRRWGYDGDAERTALLGIASRVAPLRAPSA